MTKIANEQQAKDQAQRVAQGIKGMRTCEECGAMYTPALNDDDRRLCEGCADYEDYRRGKA
ncbi:MAG: hypothetical protein LIR10_07670 [Bacillota bacterium]|nr:hypothetical protein [Bacillota bacterium]